MAAYADIPLCTLTPDVAAWIGTHIPIESFHFAPIPNLQTLRPLMPYPDQMASPIKIGTLSWPQGASRWAMGHFIATEGQLAQIRQKVYQVLASQTTVDPTATPGAATLQLDDGTTTIDVPNMYMLPPRPLGQNPFNTGHINTLANNNDLIQWNLPRQELWLAENPANPEAVAEPFYLVTFVDARWFWWNISPSVNLGTATTWDAVFSSLADDINGFLTDSADFGTNTPDSVYLTPPDAFKLIAHHLPLLLDHAALATGQRVVADWSTSHVDLQDASSARVIVNGQLANEEDENLTRPWRTGGGLYAFADDTTGLGDADGNLVVDSCIYLPSSVTVAFPSKSDVEAPKADHRENTTLLYLLANDLIDYPKSTSATNAQSLNTTMMLQSSQIATYDATDTVGGDSPTNSTALAALAKQMSIDWYLWQLGRMDVMYAHLVEWQPEGFNDLEWNTVPPSTRVTRLGNVGTSVPPTGTGGAPTNSSLDVTWIILATTSSSGGWFISAQYTDKDLGNVGACEAKDANGDTPQVSRYYLAKRATDKAGPPVKRRYIFSATPLDTFTSSTGDFVTNVSGTFDPTTCTLTITQSKTTIRYLAP